VGREEIQRGAKPESQPHDDDDEKGKKKIRHTLNGNGKTSETERNEHNKEEDSDGVDKRNGLYSSFFAPSPPTRYSLLC